MGQILDQTEIDALLEAVEGGAISLVEEETKTAPVSLYDFKRPERVSKEQLRAFETLHEVFARNLGVALSTYLRTIIEVKMIAVEQLTYSEFIMSLPNPTCFNLIHAKPLEGNMILEVNPSILFPILDRLLGGGRSEGAQVLSRPFTEIEWGLINGILARILTELTKAWETIKKLDFEIVESEGNPQLMQILAPNELVVLIFFEVRLGDQKGILNFCIPFMAIEPIITQFAAHHYFSYSHRGATQEQGLRLVENVSAAPVDVDCCLLETEVPLRSLLRLRVGDVLRTGRYASTPAMLRVAGKPMFWGYAGSFRNRYAARIERLVETRRTGNDSTQQLKRVEVTA